MQPNVGKIDRAIRVVAGLALLSLLFVLPGNARWWGLLGVPLLVTAFVRWCPGYALIGASTDGGAPDAK
ncbi:MAG TPA: DUF2892 domain-containing protein [Burkholderiales bacterium]|nr:DUF2892 domain-containing protein [Burkholderiales bacterium]